ncbi:MAG TPA: ATP-binding protein [Thermoanaerobaculia bacterium]|nr:ATP-binding protein [Thermoanaerobaculia bacterium]
MAQIARRICLTGPECTAKTTIAAQLARELGVPFVPEYSREYAETCGHTLTAADVEPIARGTIAAIDAAGDAHVLDTDLISTVVYARHYYGACPPWIVAAARAHRADLYLLMNTDLPWEPDGIRDTPGPARETLFHTFRAALEEFDASYEIVSGVGEARVENALRAIRRG